MVEQPCLRKYVIGCAECRHYSTDIECDHTIMHEDDE